MPALLLGPLLRYVGETEATVWVETDSPCEVEVLGHRERTFTVDGHHFALVCVEGLEPGSETRYEVALDGERRWPRDSDLPPSAIRTTGGPGPLEVCFGSCRVSLPHEEPYVCEADSHPDAFEYDALRVLARELARGSRKRWPQVLMLLGDQVYVDEGAPATRERIRQRRGTDEPPGEEVTDFEEYTWLYHEAWGDSLIRWLLSTVSTSMVWDDHDMSDDWNISRSWLEEMRRKPWWHHRAVAGIVSYWIYQHLGNLSPKELAANDLYQRIRGDDRATEKLREFAVGIDSEAEGTRWSFCRDFGAGTRAIFMDSRAGRVLEEGRRSMVDDDEWSWIVEHARGDFDHLLIATTVPFLLSPGLHHLEAWSERVCDGAWGAAAARACEKLRRGVDFDHWASFGSSFRLLRDLIAEIGSGAHGEPPKSIVLLSGDVHHAYLVEAGFPPDAGMRSAVYQGVCSPYRNPLSEHERRVIRAGFSRPFTLATRTLARSAGVPDPGIGWRLAEGPFFDNQVATLTIDDGHAAIGLDKTVAGDEDEQRLERVFDHRLA